MADIKFGTDGWRAVISDDFTFENVRIVAQAVADFVKSRKSDIYRKRSLVVGFDTRFLSEKYAEIIACILAANGIKVILADRACSTPSVGLCIRAKKLTGGVMITASHNPPQYNGIKYKNFSGGSAGSEIIDDIEKRLSKSAVKSCDISEAIARGIVKKENLMDRQVREVRKFADMKLLKKARLKVLVDSMNGTGGRYLEEVLKGTGIKLDYIYADSNPSFNGRAPEPNEKHLKELMSKVRKGKYDLGVATDGDSDRVGIVDEKGNMLTGHKVMALLLVCLFEERKMKGAVVQTVCGTRLIDRMAEEYGLKTYETPVGFKYICDTMISQDILIGGEETGGIGFKGYIPERDGFLSALLIMELMVSRKKKIGEIVSLLDKKYGSFVYEREDILFDPSKRQKLLSGLKKKPLQEVLGKKVIKVNASDGHKFILSDGTWLLLRLSGTEPKLRVYSETPSKKKSLEYLKFGKKYAFDIMK
jgi:alpha-D-glucose phosphate-specific phosphoglucomutase